MKKIPVSLLCGAAAVVITIVAFFTIFNNIVLQAIHFISLVAIVFAEIITTVYAMFSAGNPRKVGAAVVSAFMIPFAAVLSVVYISNFPPAMPPIWASIPQERFLLTPLP